jgi:hypothetical protein
MPKLEFSISDSSPCFFCGADLSLDHQICSSCGSDENRRFTFTDVYEALLSGDIVDARAGGLVLGRENNIDDIPMIVPIGIGIFQLVGIMQGGEFILNKEISTKYHEKITEINSYKNNSYTPLSSIEITVRASRIINTNFRNKDIVLLADSGQFIVNPAATAKYYYELEKLNSLID